MKRILCLALALLAITARPGGDPLYFRADKPVTAGA